MRHFTLLLAIFSIIVFVGCDGSHRNVITTTDTQPVLTDTDSVRNISQPNNSSELEQLRQENTEMKERQAREKEEAEMLASEIAPQDEEKYKRWEKNLDPKIQAVLILVRSRYEGYSIRVNSVTPEDKEVRIEIGGNSSSYLYDDVEAFLRRVEQSVNNAPAQNNDPKPEPQEVKADRSEEFEEVENTPSNSKLMIAIKISALVKIKTCSVGNLRFEYSEVSAAVLVKDNGVWKEWRDVNPNDFGLSGSAYISHFASNPDLSSNDNRVLEAGYIIIEKKCSFELGNDPRGTAALIPFSLD